MKYYCGDKEVYVTYLTGKEQGEAPYIDPDGTYTEPESMFYDNLIKFLRKKDDIWSYRLNSEDERPGGIWVEGETLSQPLYLRSDQFGFSAPQKERARDERYPYASLLQLGGKENFVENCRFVADCVWDTRTLGGSFLWPLVQIRTSTGTRWQSMYNLCRGVGGYIEDSVDLTLHEIKCFYDLLEKNPVWSNQRICERITAEGCILLSGRDNLELCRWLKHFRSFQGYIEYFCFHPFVDKEYQVIDITKAELSLAEEAYGFTVGFPILNGKSAVQYRKGKRIASIKDWKKLYQVLLNVRVMTRRRTKEMEKRIYG